MRLLLLLTLITGGAAQGTSDGPIVNQINEINVFLPECNLCGAEWTQYEDKEYFFNNRKLSFYEAEDTCSRCGGHIISATNESEFQFTRNVLDYLNRTGTAHWLGLNYNATDDSWVGPDGISLAQTFTKWAGREPDFSDGDYPDVNCVMVNGNNKLKDRGCDHGQNSVCGRPTGLLIPMAPECNPTEIPPQTDIVTNECEMRNWRPYMTEENDLYEFSFNNDKLTFSEAVEECSLCEGELVTARSEREFNITKEVLQAMGKDGASYWLGAMYSEEDGQWLWLQDGTPLTYTQWAGAGGVEPVKEDDVDCIIVSNRGVWRDWDCGAEKKSLCRKGPINAAPPTSYPGYNYSTSYPGWFNYTTSYPGYFNYTTPYFTTSRPSTRYQFGSSGVLTSDGYPGRYDNNQDYNITVFLDRPGPHRVVFKALDFDLEYNSVCHWDYVILYYGEGESSRKFCGNLTGNETTAWVNGNTFTLSFHSDGSVTRRGFNIMYNATSGPELQRVLLSELVELLQQLNVAAADMMTAWEAVDPLLQNYLNNGLSDYQLSLLADLMSLLQQLQSGAADVRSAWSDVIQALDGQLSTGMSELQSALLSQLTGTLEELGRRARDIMSAWGDLNQALDNVFQV